MALFWRIWAAVAVVNLAVLTVFVGLSTLQFNNINSGLLGERLVVLAGRVAQPFQAAARLGLPLSTVRNANALLERAHQTDDAITAIHVFDVDGRIVQSTATSPPESISSDALVARSREAGSAWHRETDAGFLSGVGIFSGDGTPVGGVLVVYPLESGITRVKAMAADLSLTALAVLIATTVIAIPLLRLSLNRQIRLFEAIDSDISRFERDSWRSAAGPSPVVECDAVEGLGSRLSQAETRYRTLGRVFASDADGAR